MNFRIAAAKNALSGLRIRSVLDVGCRECEARGIFEGGTDYFGCDILQNSTDTVAFVGDVMELDLPGGFDCVMALDVLEHVDDPHALMDKLAGLTTKYLLVSLPNVYDLQHKYSFAFRDTLGDKYRLGTSNPRDRHRWVMNRDEISLFFTHFAGKHNFLLTTHDLKVGLNASSLKWKMLCTILGPLVGPKALVSTVLGLFRRPS